MSGQVAQPWLRTSVQTLAPLFPASLLAEEKAAGKGLQRFALELINDASDFSQQERPGVDEVNPVHHDGDDAVPALETSSQAVFDEEGVAEHKTMLFISEKNWAFTSWADLKGRDTHQSH